MEAGYLPGLPDGVCDHIFLCAIWLVSIQRFFFFFLSFPLQVLWLEKGMSCPFAMAFLAHWPLQQQVWGMGSKNEIQTP